MMNGKCARESKHNNMALAQHSSRLYRENNDGYQMLEEVDPIQ
jgi:hypothetical protein